MMKPSIQQMASMLVKVSDGPTHTTNAGTPVVHIVDEGDASRGLGYSKVRFPNGNEKSVPNWKLTPIAPK
jgi:hypothetical protein